MTRRKHLKIFLYVVKKALGERMPFDVREYCMSDRDMFGRQMMRPNYMKIEKVYACAVYNEFPYRTYRLFVVPGAVVRDAVDPACRRCEVAIDYSEAVRRIAPQYDIYVFRRPVKFDAAAFTCT
jgi:hypothetical protein